MLNTAGVNALLDDGNEAAFYAAIGDGITSGDEVSTNRVLLVMGAPSGAIITVTNVPMNFTGPALAAATHVLLFSAASGGVFYGYQALTGDPAFNAAGSYQIIALTIVGSGT